MRRYLPLLIFVISSVIFSQETPPVPSNPDLNWVSSINYDREGNPLLKQVNYYNTLGKLTQNQSWDVMSDSVWTSQTRYDYHGRAALQTLSVPTGEYFRYNDNFILKTDGSQYDRGDFDGQNSIENPEQIGVQPNSLGWYYSNDNDLEPYQDVTSYPFVRSVYSRLRPGAVLKTVGGNTVLKDGVEKWINGYRMSMPAPQEMYYAFGKDYFPPGETILNPASETMPAQSGYYECTILSCETGQSINNIIVYVYEGFNLVNGKVYQFNYNGGVDYYTLFNSYKLPDNSGGGFEEVPLEPQDVNYVVEPGDGNYTTNANIYGGAYDACPVGPVYDLKVTKTVTRDVHGVETVVFMDKEGNVLATSRSGDDGAQVPKKYEVVSLINKQGFVDIHIPKGCGGNIYFEGVSSSQFDIYDLVTEAKVNTYPVSTRSYNLGPGMYRVQELTGVYKENQALGNYVTIESTDVQLVDQGVQIGVRHQVNYYDYSLNFYDRAGRLTKNVQPEGFDSALTLLSSNRNHRLVSTYQYNSLGQLLETSSADQGAAKFKYRRDGQIRFSQNSKQAIVGEFSYTNYDTNARPVESGVVTNLSFATMDPDAPLAGTAITEDVIKTTYDIPADLSSLLPGTCSLPAAYQQRFVNSNISMTTTQSPKTATTVYSYDILGRVTWVVQFIEGLECPKTIDYSYDPITGQVIRVDYQRHIPGERFIHQYTYDQSGRLTTVSTSTDDVNYKQQAAYTYNTSGELTRTVIGDNLQGIDYVYNLEGKLKAINHPSLITENDPGQDGVGSSQVLPDLFGLGIDYHNHDYLRENTPTPVATFSGGVNNINGNIKALRWKSDAQDNRQHLYNYQYDKDSWLKEAEYGRYEEGVNAPLNLTVNETVASGEQENYSAQESITFEPGFTAEAGSEITARIVAGEELYTPDPNQDYMVDNINYDANGNIVNLRRNKQTENESNKMDDLSYSYYPGKNQLEHVADAVTEETNANDIKSQGGNNYVYNDIGQLVYNTEEDLTYTYTTSGLVETVSKPGVEVNFYYNDRGHRTRKESTISGITTNTYYVRDVSGNVMAIYNEAGTGTTMEHTVYGNSRIGVAKRNLGQTTLTNQNYVYQLTDHLGNVRVVVQQDENGNAVALGKTDYYPFGMAMPGRNMEGDYRYAYQGQEKDPETGKEAFELRLWDSRIGRWLTPDPYAQYHSPYLGMGNNPINGVDPDGGCFITDTNGNKVPCPQGNEIGQTMNDLDGSSWEWTGEVWANRLDEVTLFFNQSDNTNYARNYFMIPNTASVGDFQDALAESNQRILNTETFVEYGRLATDVAEIFLLRDALKGLQGGGGAPRAFAPASRVGYTSFDDIATYATTGVKESTKAGTKIIANGGTRRAQGILNQLLNNNYKVASQSQKTMTLVHRNTGEKIILRQSRSGGFSGFDTFTKNIGGKNTDILFRQ